jgi:hypothetical protein
MMFDFLILFLTFKLMSELDTKNNNFSKRQKNDFEERYHWNNRFRDVYLKQCRIKNQKLLH